MKNQKTAYSEASPDIRKRSGARDREEEKLPIRSDLKVTN